METDDNLIEQTMIKLELVLKEILDEQQKTNIILAEHSKSINSLADNKKSLEENAEPVLMNSINTKPIEEEIQKGIKMISSQIEMQPKSITRKFQILLFPEQDAKLFYKIVFGRWLLLLAAMLLINDLYKFGVQWNNNQKELKEYKFEKDRIVKAWNYMYTKTPRGIKRYMDSAYNNAHTIK